MKRTLWTVATILLGTSMILAGCKGDTGPAGAPGTSYTPPAAFCANPTPQGYNAVGTSDSPTAVGMLMGNQVVLASPGTAISLAIDVLSNPVTGQIRMGIYSNNAGEPGNLIVETGPKNLTAASWNTFDLPYDVYLPAGTYWVGWLCSNPTSLPWVSTGGQLRMYTLNGWSVLPSTFPAGGTSNTTRVSAYMNVCP